MAQTREFKVWHRLMCATMGTATREIKVEGRRNGEWYELNG